VPKGVQDYSAPLRPGSRSIAEPTRILHAARMSSWGDLRHFSAFTHEQHAVGAEVLGVNQSTVQRAVAGDAHREPALSWEGAPTAVRRPER
jgi:hypothetical protein